MDWIFYFLIETNEAFFCEHFNELFGTIGGRKFLDQLSEYNNISNFLDIILYPVFLNLKTTFRRLEFVSFLR